MFKHYLIYLISTYALPNILVFLAEELRQTVMEQRVPWPGPRVGHR